MIKSNKSNCAKIYFLKIAFDPIFVKYLFSYKNIFKYIPYIY